MVFRAATPLWRGYAQTVNSTGIPPLLPESEALTCPKHLLPLSRRIEELEQQLAESEVKAQF